MNWNTKLKKGVPLTPSDYRNQREAEITNNVKKFLLDRGWRAIRYQRMILPGSFQTGEPGQADFQFVRYTDTPMVVFSFWVEFKRASGGKRGDDQVVWQARERERGGTVLNVGDQAEMSTEAFANWYYAQFGWIHIGENATGQTELALTAV